MYAQYNEIENGGRIVEMHNAGKGSYFFWNVQQNAKKMSYFAKMKQNFEKLKLTSEEE